LGIIKYKKNKREAMTLKADKTNTAVIIPVYNAERHLPELYRQLLTHFPAEQLIFVNDCSTDNSGKLCEGFRTNYREFKINQGKGAALQAGFQIAIEKGFEFAFSIDADLQHDPAEIPNFLKKQNETNSAMIIGKRDFNVTMPWQRKFSNSTTSKVVSIVTKQDIVDSQSGYRLYQLDPIKKLSFKSTRYQFETEIIIKFAKLGAQIKFVPIQTIYNDEVSYISHFRDIGNFIAIVWHELFHKLEIKR